MESRWWEAVSSVAVGDCHREYSWWFLSLTASGLAALARDRRRPCGLVAMTTGVIPC
jgi:hypothetical protein